MKTFATHRVTRPQRSNTAIARDFLDLSFMLESGKALPVFTRFEGPITLRVTGQPPPTFEADLADLLRRLRREARIDIRRIAPDAEASLTVAIVPRRDLQRAVPQAACFVVPRIGSWAEFAANRRAETIDWTTLETRERITVFIPADVPPQELRDCLHEELAQALGPLNDLYRLPDSVFNDDNFHTVLTGFDMLILRMTYAPELRSGMTRDEVAARLPGLLARLNPAGARRAEPQQAETRRDWITAIETALGPGTSDRNRRAAATRAVEIARASDWNDNRLAFSLFALGRLSLGVDTDLALASFLQAGGIYAADPATELHEAHIAMQLAAFALSSGQAGAALAIVDDNLDVVMRAENAALLATLMLVKAEALDIMGRTREGLRLRTEALGWARYGFGSDREVLRRMGEIAAISPLARGMEEDV
ncbi:DUF2927 domain-containing protein [Palleronia sediminis]|uniref:DUF2927 domain-containing protein n=2 Tax=Palleronia sediminis TaxID=2547833 RepID=A0A4R6AJD7_9RHOB|nr:DUF2927 domain-containing protein [Palleronia sediminis]